MTKVMDVEEVGLVHIPKKQEDANKAQVPMQAGKNQMDTIYDRYQKKVYLFDRSFSMESGMAPEDEKAMYLWTEDTLTKFRQFIADQLQVDVVAGKEDPDEAADLVKKLADDEELKKYIIEHKLHLMPGMAPARDYNHIKVTERKIEAVRGAMKRFVEKRFQKFPDAQVGMVGFGSSSRWMVYPGAPKPEVMLAIDGLAPDMGGTNIVSPISMAMTEFKKRPSHVGSHHIVMVSDAEAYIEKSVVMDFLHQMKELNVVMDFIYIQGQDEATRYAEINPDSALELLKKMCKETGGEFVTVRKSSDFEIKFFQASERKALPPAGGR